jgi:hypothetical protein
MGVLERKELYIFTDVSEWAYAAVIYVRRIGTLREWRSSLLTKKKIASFKSKFIPCLGVLLAALLFQKIAERLHFDKDAFYA